MPRNPGAENRRSEPPRPERSRSVSNSSAASALAIVGLLLLLAGSLPHGSSTGHQSGVERYEGDWQLEPLGDKDLGRNYIQFGAANSAVWYRFETADSCWTSRHQYRIKGERMIFTPPLPDQRTWWSPNFETPARIELLERTKTDQGRSSQKMRLVRASIPSTDCAVRDLSKKDG